MPAVEVKGVRKAYALNGRVVPVLDSVSFSVGPGEFVAILGPSGCGKSTLLNLIAGLEEPSAGTIAIQGAVPRKRTGLCAYMHQKDLLLPWRTVLDNAILPLEVQGVPRKAARERALALMDVFGLRGFEHAYPFTLSGGMRQRAAFLRTVLAGKSIVLLDEPFGALDALTRASLQDWLASLWEALRLTVLLVTHDVEEALFLADRVLVLTPRPARVRGVVPVSLPRPRQREMVTSPPFVRLKAEVFQMLTGTQVAQEAPP
ncbi:Aliphatic sulfonates import ATP-binding protein SsuB [bacterium HR23]|nr:Aliphatic sulfonates import ATP-binding protein SsuB [bacterium HR23]